MNENPNLNRIDTFLKIVEAGSISKAAKVLQVPKSKLSRNLALLESDLGVQLIYRTTRQFQLTASGRKFYRRAKLAMDEVLGALLEAASSSGSLSGTIRLTAPEDLGTYVITGIIDQFKIQYPDVKFNLLFTNQVLDLVKDRIDIAVRIGRLKDSSMISRTSGGIDFIFVTSRKYLDEIAESISIEDLTSLKTVAFVSGNQTAQWNATSARERRTIKVKPHMTFDHFVALREMVVLGHGIGFMPRYLCERDLAEGRLVHILKSWGSDTQPIQVLVPHQKEMPPLIRTFSDFLNRHLSTAFA